MKTSEMLERAKALIADPEHWTKGTLARDAKGNYANYNGPEATCFCMRGALCRVQYENERDAVLITPLERHEGWEIRRDAERRLRRVLKNNTQFDSVSDFNDHAETTHENVLVVMDTAIQQEKRHELDAAADQSA
jgi:hypothetical protein